MVGQTIIALSHNSAIIYDFIKLWNPQQCRDLAELSETTPFSTILVVLFIVFNMGSGGNCVFHTIPRWPWEHSLQYIGDIGWQYGKFAQGP